MCNCTVHKLRYAHWAGRQWQLWMGERSCDSVHGCTLPSRLLPRQNQINFCQWGCEEDEFDGGVNMIKRDVLQINK